MYELSPRKFEELVAELYRRRGFKVTLTSSTGGKGVDVYVVRHDELGSSLSVVQAKRYRPDRKIGVSLVRELKGTVATTNASAGVLLTTSFFTKGAKALAAEYEYTLAFVISTSSRHCFGYPRSCERNGTVGDIQAAMTYGELLVWLRQWRDRWPPS